MHIQLLCGLCNVSVMYVLLNQCIIIFVIVPCNPYRHASFVRLVYGFVGVEMVAYPCEMYKDWCSLGV